MIKERKFILFMISPFNDWSGEELREKMQLYVTRGFCRVFQRESVADDADFYSLGGNDEAVAALQYRCRELFISRKMIEEGRTPSGIVELCLARPRVMRQQRDVYPLSRTQEGIYIESVKRHEEFSHQLRVRLQLDASVDIERLMLAMKGAAELHPGLATQVTSTDEGELVQFLAPDFDATPLLISEPSQQHDKEQWEHPFDWENGELFQWSIVKTESGAYLNIRAHYLIMDRWALQVLLEDIDSLYRGESAQAELLTNFAPCLRDEYLRGSEFFVEARDWFLQRFEGLELDSLPHPDAQVEAIGYAQLKSSWSAAGLGLDAFCSAQSLSASTYFAAAWSLCLARWNDDKSSLFSMMYHGRSSVMTQRQVALHAKPLPLYMSSEGIESVVDYLHATQQQIFQTRNYDVFSLSELNEATGIDSKMLFAFEEAPAADRSFCEAPLCMEELDDLSLGGELSLRIIKQGEDYQLLFSYARDSFSEDLIRELGESYSQILRELCARELLCDIRSSSEEQQRVLQGFNPCDIIEESQDTLISLFQEQCRLRPEKTALVFQNRSYSYAQVDALSSAIAADLSKRGVQRGQVVSLLLDRTEWMLIAALGVMKCACTYQPLDPNYPSERLNYMIQDASACMLIADEELRELVNEYEGDTLFTKDIPALPAADRELPACQPEDNYVLLYTSGSTGQAKGCALQHRHMVSLIRWVHEFYHMDEAVKTPLYASFGFDAHMMDHYPPLMAGGTLYVIADEMRLDLIGLEEYFNEVGITHAFLTTQLGRQFALSAQVKTMRYLSMGGEALVPLDPPKDFTMVNLYGPTECTIAVTHYPLEKRVRHMPIGRPMSRTKLYVADAAGRLQPPGAQGELLISGAQVSQGYLNRDELTAKAFVSNPYDSQTGYERLYRTGDVVRWLTDGTIEFLGRRDAQVKIRGFRIELSEVESIVRDFEGIKDATIQAFSSPNGGKFMAAYVVADEPVDRIALAAFIEASKPAYMVPEFIVQLESIPLTPNQKVNKRALPDPLLEAPSVTEVEESGTPNPLEEQLIAMLRELLGGAPIGVRTPFAHAGLSSISAIKLAVMVYKRFQVRIDAKKLQRHGCIADVENQILTHWLAAENQAETHSPTHAPATQELGHGYPLSAAQLGIFYECLKSPESTIYNLPSRLRLPATLSQEELEKALQRVLGAHAAFNIRFDTSQGQPQQVQEDFPVTLAVSTTSEADLQSYSEAFIAPFDLLHGPLYRFELVSTESAEYQHLLVDIHHLISDGYSWDLFVRQLCAALDGEEIEQEGFSPFEALDEEMRADTARAKEFFAQQLIDFEASTELEGWGDTDPAEAGLQGEHIELIEPQALDAACQRMKLTPAELFLSCLSVTLARYVNNQSVYISMVSSGRNDPRLADTMGMFVKTVPLALSLGDESIQEWGEKTAQLLADTLEHEHYPYAQIAADYGYKPSVVYAYQVGLVGEFSVQGTSLEIEPLSPPQEKAMFKLGVFIEWKEGQYALTLRYDKGLYSAELMAHFAKSMHFVLQQQMEQSVPLAKNLSLVTPAREEQLQGFRCVAQSELPHKLLHQGLEEQARLKPEKTALVSVDGSWTYEEFNATANRVAHGLIARGVKPGMRVALLLGRDSRLPLALFGVLKAGAAYIPCDPDYPADRISHILEDSEAKFIITSESKLAEFAEGIALDIEELLLSAEQQNPDLGIAPENLAYLIYTSGSTGKPKGVMLRHLGICNYLTPHPANFMMAYMAQDATAMMAVSTISFDISLIEVVNPLFNGLTLVLADDDQTHDPIALAGLFAKTGADCFCATPSRFMQFMDLPEFSDALAKCKALVVAGEMYPKALHRRLQGMTQARIFNAYGPTEITVSSNNADVTHSDRLDVGPPLLNYIEYIVDADGNELPAGLVGELYIGGTGVAVGYNKLEELTQQQFIEYKGIRVYKSGDYAHWTPEGSIMIHGRKDSQVKLRGLRIELGEIESCMSQLEGIKRVAITIRKLPGGNEELCAHYTAERPMDVDWMREQLSKKLTIYMIPSLWLQMDELPQTPNGKTDLRALPDPTRQGVERAYVAPVGEKEEFYCASFARILGLDRVSAEDSFFDLGGTSLIATRVIIDAAKVGIRLAYGELFSNPTPRKLAHMGETSENTPVLDEIAQYDYTAIHALLQQNNLSSFKSGDTLELGDILLTGATGFLGIHILKQLLDDEAAPRIYCILRDKEKEAGVQRLQTLLHYYFQNSYAELFGTRIIPLSGDLKSLDAAENISVDTVINCAANVKHFSQTQEIAEANVDGVDSLIQFCLTHEAKLVHVSTISVSGLSVNKKIASDRALLEQELYLGQDLDNQYTNSKFLAERHILEAIVEKNLSAKIMRVGNLSPRQNDGLFQINAQTNSSMGRLRSFSLLGCCPYDILDEELEFSPIDETAHCVLLLAKTPKNCCLFHPYHPKPNLLHEVILAMNSLGLRVDAVEEEEYQIALNQAKLDPEKVKYLASIIAYQDMAHGQEFAPIPLDNSYTMQVLYRMGYHWESTTAEYMERFLRRLVESKYFL